MRELAGLVMSRGCDPVEVQRDSAADLLARDHLRDSRGRNADFLVAIRTRRCTIGLTSAYSSLLSNAVWSTCNPSQHSVRS
jgi:hypothetical protein